MTNFDWSTVFDEKISQQPGANHDRIEQFAGSVLQPISEDEVRAIRPEEYPESWILPSGDLPESYLNFLRWSDGGEFRNGDRLIQFFSSREVRSMMLAYSLPRHVPGIYPFAFNGGGIFYAFDMRFRMRDGEYNVVAAECGHAHTPFLLNSTFLDACRVRSSIEEAWDADDEFTRPFCERCSEFLVCPACGNRGTTKHY